MSECEHNCNQCDHAEGCEEKHDFHVDANASSSIRRVIGVVSGKGGVGKSFVTSALAVGLRRKGLKTAILDADITGPSIPQAFGLHEKATGDEHGIYPAITKTGIEVMSLNLLIDDETSPVIWRGPIIAGTVKQFWSDVYWGDVDYMLVDMPPGTGDVPLTVFQSLPIDGIIVVTSPQDLVTMVVEKAVNMAKQMNIPLLGLVENYSYYVCPDCHAKHELFGKSHIEEVALSYGIAHTARMPLDPEVAKDVDNGLIENYKGIYLDDMVEAIGAMK